MALYKAGLATEIPVVEMPPVPGAKVKVYKADDKNYEKPLAEAITDEKGNYSFKKEDFDDPNTDEVEMPPQVPIVVRAEFRSPIDKTKKVAIEALVDPTDEEKAVNVEVDPLTHAIAEKIKTFVEETFEIQVTKEIMDTAKPFIDMIVKTVRDKGLTDFNEDDVVIGKYESEESEEVVQEFVPEAGKVADRVIDKGTAGLFESMESSLIEKAEEDGATLGTGATLNPDKKLAHFVKFFASTGFPVQVGPKEGENKVIVFMPIPPFISDTEIPGTQVFNDRAFRMIDPENDFSNLSNVNPEILFRLKEVFDELPVMSHAAVVKIAEAAKSGKTTTLAKMAAVIKEKFEWKTEGVRIVNGIPIFSDVMQTPKTGAEVSPSELISEITTKFGDTPKEIARDIASKPHYIIDMADEAIQYKIHEMNDPSAIQNFLKGIDSFDKLKEFVQGTEIFKRKVEDISHRIFASLDPELYGKTISATTPLKIKTALMLLHMMIDRDYLIDKTEGWFKKVTEGGITRVEPNFGNLKWLEPKEESSAFLSEMLGLIINEEIEDGETFKTLVDSIHTAIENMEEPEEYKKIDVDMMQQFTGEARSDKVTLTGVVKNYDGTVMAGMELKLKYFDEKGHIQDFEGGPVTTDENGKFTFSNVPSGYPYEIRFTGRDFIFPFFVDGFQPYMDMGEIWLPPPAGMGGPMGFPGISLWVDQKFFNPVNPQDENNGKLEGVDFSNFNTEKPFIVFEGSDQGTPDLFWKYATGLTTAEDAKIASLGEGPNHQHGLASGPVIDHVFTKEELEGLNWVDSIARPEEDNAVYVIKDVDGKYFFIEVRWWDKDPDGNPNGMIDMGFAKLGSDGRLEVPKEEFIGGPPIAMPGGPVTNMFFEMNPGDYLDLETGFITAPPQEPFSMYWQNARGVEGYDIRWLGVFYDSYWAGEDNWNTRNAYLSESDRAISVINNATLSTITISTTDGVPTVTITPDDDGVVKDILPGTMLLVETADQGNYILGVNWVEKDAIGLMVIPKDQMIDESGNLKSGIEDKDGDGIPNILDDNDFKQDVFDETWQQEQFQMVDEDGDGVPAEFDPNDHDPNVPNAGGNIDKDGDGLVGGADPDDNNPNDPVYHGNWDEDKDGWPKAIDPDDNNNMVPGEEEIVGGGKKVDLDGDGIPSDMDPNDDPAQGGADVPVVGGNQDNDNDGFPKGIEEWSEMGGMPGNDNDPAIYPGAFKPEEVSIQVTGTPKVAIVWLKEDYPGAPPYWEFISIYELSGLTLTEDMGKYFIANVTPAEIIGVIPDGWPQFGLNNARAEILLIDDIVTENNGPQFDIYPGGDTIVGVAFEYELEMIDGTWHLYQRTPMGPQPAPESEFITIHFGPKY